MREEILDKKPQPLAMSGQRGTRTKSRRGAHDKRISYQVRGWGVVDGGRGAERRGERASGAACGGAWRSGGPEPAGRGVAEGRRGTASRTAGQNSPHPQPP